MLRLSFQKIWNKKWMNMCLVLGVILLVATMTSFPLYEDAAYDRMLQDQFEEYLTEEGQWPTRNILITYSKKDKKGKTIANMEKYISELEQTLNVKNELLISYYASTNSDIHSEMDRPDLSGKYLRIASLTGIEDHANIIYGENFSEDGIADDGAIEVIIDQSCMIEKGLLLGETIYLDSINDANGNPTKVRICGVFDTSNNDDFYWQIDSLDKLNNGFVKEETFRDIFLGDRIGKYNITCNYYQLFNYKDISYTQVQDLYNTTKYLTEKSKYRSIYKTPDYQKILKEYLYKQTRISGTLKVLLIPVLILLAAFLIMISKQMYEMEQNEISVIKSRGSYRIQIFGLYTYQNIVLTLVGGALGVLLGRVFASVLGSTRNFLEFNSDATLNVQYGSRGLMFAGAGMLFSFLVLTLPAISHSAISIVKVKQKKSEKKKPLWQKLYIDIILLGVSVYGYYSFNKDLNAISETVLSGESLDPLLYISSSLFILGAGLLYLRLQPLIVQCIFLIGRKVWGPAGYISFMENRKNGRKQHAIMLFLIMTISLGMYHAIVARTILDNALENQDYLDGADIIIRENWQEIRNEDGMPTGEYIEPGFQKYLTADFTEAATKVYYDNQAYLADSKSDRTYTVVMGIHTKEFGSMTTLSDKLNEKSYYEYLNELAVVSDGLLVSSNYASVLGYDIGETLSFRSADGKLASGKIVDFVDYWPGFSSSISIADADGSVHTEDGYLIVTHFELIHKNWLNVPYDVWINLKDNHGTDEVASFIQDKRISVRKYINKEKDIRGVLEDPLLQGTNGVLTLGFVVTIILCAIGYLIYWIMSVRERELVFGVLRACGFHREELVGVLLTEQLFSGLFSCLAGALIGSVTSRLFVPVLQYAYASAEQTLPMSMIINQLDMYRLYGVIAVTMIICLIVLIRILQHMNITKALKLGEE